jgi:hypothetical protein
LTTPCACARKRIVPRRCSSKRNTPHCRHFLLILAEV